MRILFVLEGKLDVRNWSGTTLSLYEVIKSHGVEVIPLEIHLPIVLRAFNMWKRKIDGIRGDLTRSSLCMNWRRRKISNLNFPHEKMRQLPIKSSNSIGKI